MPSQISPKPSDKILQNKSDGIEFEHYLEKISGISRTPGSGCGWRKGDLWLDDWLIESKHKTEDPPRFNLGWLTKASFQANDNGKPFYAVVMGWSHNHSIAQNTQINSRAIVVWPDYTSEEAVDANLKDYIMPLTEAALVEIVGAAKDGYYIQATYNCTVYNITTFELFIEQLNVR